MDATIRRDIDVETHRLNIMFNASVLYIILYEQSNGRDVICFKCHTPTSVS